MLLSPYISLVCGVHDIEVVENLVDVLAKPWALVALRSGRFLFIARAIPVDLGIVNLNEYRWGRRRGVGICVSAVYAHHAETHGSRRSKEQKHTRLLGARGIRLSEAKLSSGALESIAAR